MKDASAVIIHRCLLNYYLDEALVRTQVSSMTKVAKGKY